MAVFAVLFLYGEPKRTGKTADLSAKRTNKMTNKKKSNPPLLVHGIAPGAVAGLQLGEL